MNKVTTTIALLGLSFAAFVACDDERKSDPEQCDFYCAPGSSFPCSCNALDGCNDGAACSGIAPEHTLGFCARACQANVDCEVDIPCTGAPQCVLTTSEGMACAYVCEGDWDCPKNMACLEAGNGKLCYPDEQPDAGTDSDS